MNNNPYPGLRPFEYHDSYLFFGRDGQGEELIKKLGRSHFVAVVGTSGSGKSSLVRAGLVPLMNRGFMPGADGAWRFAMLRPGAKPIHSLAKALVYSDEALDVSVGNSSSEKEEIEVAFAENILKRSAIGLSDYVKSDQFRLKDQNLLIVVDQFEELFRFGTERSQDGLKKESADFVKLLLSATRDKLSRIYVVITMRSDYLGDCAEFRDLPEAINEGQYLIPRLARDELRQAIECPSQNQGVEVSGALVTHLLNEIGDDQDQLPILQHSLMRTWDNWLESGSPKTGIEFDHYRSTGGMENALSLHADQVLKSLDNSNQQAAQSLFKVITEIDHENREIRRATALSEITKITGLDEPEIIEVVNAFRRTGRTFLMPPFPANLNGASVIDISHESLIRKWKTLREWVDEEAVFSQIYRRLAQDAYLYRTKKEGFCREPYLSHALKWRKDNSPNSAWADLYYKSWGSSDLASFAETIQYLEESARIREQELAVEEKRRNQEIEDEKRLRKIQEEKVEQEQQLREIQEEKAIELEKSEKKLKRLVRVLMLASILLLISVGTAVAYAIKASLAQTELVDTNSKLEKQQKNIKTANDQLKTSKKALITTNIKLNNSKEFLSTKNDELEAAIKLAAKEAKRATDNEAKTQEALIVQKRLRDLAESAKSAADSERNTALDALKKAEIATTKALAAARRESTNRKALTFLEKGEKPQAIGEFEKIIRFYDEDEEMIEPEEHTEGKWWGHHNLGKVFASQKRFSDAECSFAKSLELLAEPVEFTKVNETKNHIACKVENRHLSRDVIDNRIEGAGRERVATLRELGRLYTEWAKNVSNQADAQTLEYDSVRSYNRLVKLLPDARKKSRVYLADVYVELADAISRISARTPAITNGDSACADLSFGCAINFLESALLIYQEDLEEEEILGSSTGNRIYENYSKQIDVHKLISDIRFEEVLSLQESGVAEGPSIKEKSKQSIDHLLIIIHIQENKMNLSPMSQVLAESYEQVFVRGNGLGTFAGYPLLDYRDISFEIKALSRAGSILIPRRKRLYRNTSFERLAHKYVSIGKIRMADKIYRSGLVQLELLLQEKEEIDSGRYIRSLISAYAFFSNELRDIQMATQAFERLDQYLDENPITWVDKSSIDWSRSVDPSSHERLGDIYADQGNYRRANDFYKPLLLSLESARKDWFRQFDVKFLFQSRRIGTKNALLKAKEGNWSESKREFLELRNMLFPNFQDNTEYFVLPPADSVGGGLRIHEFYVDLVQAYLEFGDQSEKEDVKQFLHKLIEQIREQIKNQFNESNEMTEMLKKLEELRQGFTGEKHPSDDCVNESIDSDGSCHLALQMTR